MKHLALLTTPLVLLLVSCKDDHLQYLQQELSQSIQLTQQAQQDAETYKVIALAALALVIVALVFGTILGSSAKKKSQQP